jgi:hypothetical protein
MAATKKIQIATLLLSMSLFFACPSEALKPPSVRSVIAVSNFMAIVAAMLMISSATMDVVEVYTNNTALIEPRTQVGAVSMVLYAAGNAVSIVGTAMGKPKLVDQLDAGATFGTAVGFVLTAAGLWSSNANALLAGSVELSAFFLVRAFLLPLILKKHPTSFRPSDKYHLFALTVLGNIGGLFITWSNFERSEYHRQILQTGLFLLGIVNTVAISCLTINLYRLAPDVVAHHV